ncbi:hypothetical protein [Lachnospira pectinoschiza]|uniref:Uncharacterized protein n=1 Tax=Lachnospira pectinoschiza TaxID=28052 RepID=A0A1G9UER9_9FIRM|nr:hypothetical protein [Lachnospira pectinoschiza]SDM58406.1 hypothetical protein SAMN05216544_0734 [Lachnospira pectinoschiza]
MGFFDKKQKLDILEKTQYNLEQTQANLAQIQNALVSSNGTTVAVTDNTESTDAVMELDPDTRAIMAAYALNLCTVSVTQIIDYQDLNIMEQEYDMILNNLNLQNMPNDDALLDILKQILNTVTFFRIDQKEREFVERDYQQKMKNAVWSAVPNVGALIATGLSQGPAMMAVSLAATVGTAYMNYRKQKADNSLAFDREMWQLERSAIEQLDGLKRELFDTAWRLSKHYGFEDKLRLSERQIHQYNQILMDTDDERRYDRLEVIADNFRAYPPFWYQYGHTATLIALGLQHRILDNRLAIEDLKKNQKSDKNFNETLETAKIELASLEEAEKKYRAKAKEHFEYFQKLNRYGLLREDKMVSMCNLEYVDLLLQDENYNKEHILNLIQQAIDKAGSVLEIVQLCVFAYMKLGEAAKAEKYLKMLVNEHYNQIMNAQILSSLYVYDFFSNEGYGESLANYNVLCKRVPKQYLFPMPKKPTARKSLLEKQFIYVQKTALLKKYEYVLNNLTRTYANRFNRCLPLPEGLNLDDELFNDSYESRLALWNRISGRLMSYDGSYKEELAQTDLLMEYMKVLQDYFYEVVTLVEEENSAYYREYYQQLKEDILSPISENTDEITEFRASLLESDEDILESLEHVFNKYTFMFFVGDMLSSLTSIITDKVTRMEGMNDIAADEARLMQFCQKNSIPTPTEQYIHDTTSNMIDAGTDFLVEQLLGNDEYERLKKRTELRSGILELITDYCNEYKIIIRSNKSRLFIREQDDARLNEYFKKIKGKPYNKTDVLAVIEEHGLWEVFNYKDLWLTTDGVVIVESDNYGAVCTPYERIVKEGNEIKCGNKRYNNEDDVNMFLLWQLIVDIEEYIEQNNPKKLELEVSLSDNCFEVIEEKDNPMLYLSYYAADEDEEVEE